MPTGRSIVGPGRGVQGSRTSSTSPGDRLAAFQHYPYRLAELAIGIVPLADNPFNDGKSALKMSQFAALGVPVIASPTPDNLRLHGLGIGLIAHSPVDWRRCLELLIADAGARAELADRGRQIMATQTYESQADRWWGAWTSVIGPSTREGSFVDLMPVASP